MSLDFYDKAKRQNETKKAALDFYGAAKNGVDSSWTWEDRKKAEENKKSALVSLSTKDGKNFGEISYAAYDAIVNDKLDNYKPLNDSEKKVLSDFAKYLSDSSDNMPKEQKAYIKYTVNKESEIKGINNNVKPLGGNNALISPAPKKGWFEKTVDKVGETIKDVFLPEGSNAEKVYNEATGFKDNKASWTDDDLAKFAVNALHNAESGDTRDFAIVDEALARLSKSEKYKNSDLVLALGEAQKSWGASPLTSAWKNIKAATLGMGADIASFANSLGADYIPGVKNVTNAAVEAGKKAREEAAEYNKGSFGENAGAFTQGVVNLVPYMVLGGGPGVKDVLGAPKYAGYIKSIAQNPSFYYSLTSMWGNKYQEAIDGGASKEDAVKNAMLYAIPSALIEVSGGVGSAEKSGLAKTIIGEIGEELVQDVMNGISNKFTTNPDLPVLSTKEDAIINPVNMLKTAAITAPIVAVAGGANRIANLAYQKAYLMKQGSNKKVTDAILKYSDAVYSKVNGETDIEPEISKSEVKKIGSLYSDPLTLRNLINEGIESSSDSEAHTIAESLRKKRLANKNISSKEIGELVIANIKQFASASDISSANENVSESVKASEKDTVTVGNIYRNSKNGGEVEIVERDDKNTTVILRNGKNVKMAKYSNNQMDVITSNKEYELVKSGTPKSDGEMHSPYNEESEENIHDFTKEVPMQHMENVQTPHSTVRSTSADIDTSDDIIHSTPLENGGNTSKPGDNSPVILTMGDTFKPNTLGTLAANGVSSVYDFANEVIEYYNQNGNINPYASYFKDNGASVISRIKEISEVNRNVNTEQTVSGRTDIHNENMGWTSDARAGEYGGEFSEGTGETESQGRSREEFEQRRNRTQQLRESGKLIPGELKVRDKIYTYDRIPVDNISDDAEALAIIRQNRARGLKTVFISGDIVGGKLQASGVHYGDTVYISYDNEQSPAQINDHELVHFSSDTKAYADFKKSVFDKLTEKEKEKLRREISQRYNEAVIEYMNRAYENNPNLSGKEVVDMYNAYLDEEILANLNAGTLTLSVDVSEEIAEFRKAIGGYETSDVETTPADAESEANNSPAEYKNEIDGGGVAKFLISKNFEIDYDTWVSEGRKDGVKLKVGATSDALKSINVKEQNIYWDSSKINKSLKSHKYLDDNIMKQIPNLLENPIIVMQSKSFDSRITMFGEVYDGDGVPIMAVLELLPTNKTHTVILDEIKVVSSHSRKDKKHPSSMVQTQNMINTSDILYIEPNKKRTDTWLVANRLQLPLHITKYGSIKSVTYPEGNVNNNSMQKSSDDAEKTKYNSVSEKAEDVLKDSVARDSNGKLKIMYRGGKENINVFDRKKSKPSNLYGRGFYFTDDKQTAERYGDVREYYLNIKNPLRHGDYNVTKEQMRKFLEAVAENEDDYDIWNYGTTDIDEILDNLYGKDDFWMIQDVSATAIGDLVEAIELFNEVNGTNYDGIMLETETVIFDSSQAKLADEVTYDDNGDEIPLSKRITESKDVRFNITSNDSEGTPLTNAQQEYFKDSKIRVSEVDGWKNTITENGLLFPVYHGTNSGEFYEFDESAIGSANDRGWFGKGFYFAFTEDEAEYYGSRILKCYLNVKKPFIYDEEMGGFDGQNNGDVNFDFASFIINVAEKFPDIAQKTYVDVAELNSDEIIQKSFSEFADEIKSIYKGDRLSVVEVDDRGEKIYQYRYSRDIDSIDAPENIKSLIKTHYIDGDWMANFLKEKGTITESECDDILDAIERNGTEQLRDAWLISRFDSREQAEKNRLSAVVEYLRRNKYSYIDQHLPHYYMTSSMGDSFTEEIRKRGYDGIIQSRYGDEVVVFEKNQIKLTSNTNPTANPDIRFNISSEEPDLKTQHYIEQKAEEIADEELINAAKLNTSEVVSMVRKNSDLQKRLTNAKRQMTVSKAKTVNAAEVGKVVKEVISELQGTVDSKVIGPEVMQIYNDYYLDVKKAGKVESKIQIANDKMAERLVHIAEKIINSSEAILESEDYGALKLYLRETRIKFPDYAKNELEFGAFRKSHMGTFNLTNDGLPLDSAYQDLCETFPHLFSREVTDPIDQLNLMDETLSKLTPDVYNPHANHTKDATEYAVYRLVSALDGISATPDTKADRMYKKSLWEKEQAVEKVKGDYERKLDKLKKDSEEKISKLRKDLSAQHYIRYWETRLSKEEKAETLKRYREKQKVALLKSKIRSVVSDFRAGLNKTEKAGGYPKELVTTVADVCSVLDFHTDRTGENGEPTKVSLKLDTLKTEYDNLKDNKAYGEYAEEYSEELSKDIGDLYKLTKGKRVIDLSVFELENLYNILKEIRHELSIATKQIGLEKSISNMEIGEEIIKTWEEKADLIEKDKAQLLQSLRSADASTRAFVFNPHRINRFIAGYDENSAWWQMYDQLNRGVRKAAKFTSDANKPFDELTSGNGGNEVAFFDFRTKLYDVGLVDKNGRKVTLTKSIMCELLMTWERDQGKIHLQNGGVKIPNIEMYNKGKTSASMKEGASNLAKVNQSHIDRIKSMLDSYDLEWIERAKHLYNVVGRNAINQTSMELQGREVAKAENYIRIFVDNDFVKTDIKTIKYDVSIEGNGSLKATVKDAKQPVILRGLHENVYDHIDFVSKYYGLAIPIRNFNKVYNVSVWNVDGSESSVKNLIGTKFGSEITKYAIDDVLTDLHTTREKPRDFVSRAISAVRGKWIGAVFYGNLSSMLKQTTSYWTASAYLSESSLVKGLSEYMRHTKTTRAEISEYTGTLYKRAQGLSTTELGERAERKRLAGASNKVTKAINQYAPWLKNIPEGLRPGNWLQAMDCTVATALWEACKIEVRDKMGISADNPEYMTTVTDLYDKVVEETQSNYDTLHRPEALKTTNELTKTLTMFQTDNLQQTGLIYDAYANMKNKSEAYKKNGSAENKKSYDDAKRQFGKVVKARVYSTIWLSMVTMLGAMALRKFLPYKDEEENDITAGSVAHRSLINMAEDMFCTLIPVGGNLILNVVDAFNNGYDFLSEPAFDSLRNFIDTSAKLIKAYVSDEEGPEKQAKIDKAWSKFIVAAGNVTGIPVNNFKNLYNGVKGYALDIAKGDFAHDISNYSSSKALYTYGDLAACLTTGDIQLEEKILNYYSNNGKSLTKASLTKEIKAAYVELYADDPNKGKLLQSKLIKKYGYDEDTIEKWPLTVLVDAIQNGDEELQRKIRKAFPGISESKVKKELEKRQKAKDSSKISPKSE